jgi:hypothetical protein
MKLNVKFAKLKLNLKCEMLEIKATRKKIYNVVLSTMFAITVTG